MNRASFLGTGLFLFLLAVGPAAADRAELPLGTATIISSEAGAARVLFRAPDLAALGDPLIFSAHLEFTLPRAATGPETYVQVNAITRDWATGSVSWTSPWTRAGGDRDDTYFRSGQVDAEATALRLDVTSLVRAMVEGEIESYGFMLSVPYGVGEGFRAAELSRLGTLSAGRLVVEHRQFRAPKAVRERAGRG